MSIILTFFGTLMFVALWPVCANIYYTSETAYIAARWAIILWVLTADAAIFGAALWTGGYIH